MINTHSVEWGTDESLKNQLLKSHRTYDIDLYGGLTAYQGIEQLIYGAKITIEFHEKNKKDFNKKEIRRLKTFKKMCADYLDKDHLLTFFAESYAKAKNTNIVMTQNIDFGEVIQESIYANIDAQIKSIERGEAYRMNTKRNEIKTQCENEIKEILRQEGIRDFARKAQELIDYNLS
jgi:hypothetical protein